MSYILDALRKADAERERGHVPGIHAQPAFAGSAPASARSVAPPWLWAGAGALLLVTIAALLWAVLGRSPAAPAAVAPPPAPPVAVVQTPAVPPAPRPEPAPVLRKPVKPTPPKPAAAQATDEPALPPPAPPTAKGGARPTAEADTRVHALNELSDEIRRQLPAVSVGGSMYSPTPANRILIINGQVLHEGDAVAPGLVLQQIRLKAAVLVFKGYRYSIAF